MSDVADYLITGKKGNGKGLFAVDLIVKALRQDKRVATNLNIFLHKLDPFSKKAITRLPDVVTADDLIALGRGQSGVVEDDNGLIIIDESSKNMGAREWNTQGRAELLDWIIHSRKHGWDVYLIAQGVSQLDKVLRNTQIEYHVQITRTDKWRFPVVGWLGKLRKSGKPFTFPRMNIATIRQGFYPGAMVCDRIYFSGKQYYELYETQQIFLDRDNPKAVGMHSMLPPYLTHGRYLPKPPDGFIEAFALVVQRFIDCDLKNPYPLKPKKQIVERIMKLPCPKQRMEFFRRFQACGSI